MIAGITYITVESRAGLDRADAEWRPGLGGNTINHAERIERFTNKLRVTTETGSIVVFTVRKANRNKAHRFDARP